MKRLNPATGLPFKYGDIREDGFIFVCYRSAKKTKINGFFDEDWYHPKKFIDAKKKNIEFNSERLKTKKGHLTSYLRGAKNRAKNKFLPFDIDTEHLKSIATDRCPVFNTVFDWGITGKGRGPDRPSLDRIIPELGYVKGNVVFISELANRIKNNVTEKELYIVADWLYEKRKEVLNAKKN